VAGQPFTVTGIGDRQDRIGAADAVVGETAYFPFYMVVGGSYYRDVPHTFTIDDIGALTVQVWFTLYKYDGSNWVDCGIANEHGNTVTATIQGMVKFNPNGGTVTPAQKYYTSDYGTYGALPTPARPGYTFRGWLTPDKKTVKTGDYTEFSWYGSPYTLTAVWKKQVTVNFNGNKGTVSPAKKVVLQTEKYGALPTPKRTKYLFLGWYTKAAGGAKVTASSTVTNGSTHTLYARWLGPKGSGKTITKAEYKRIKADLTLSQVRYLIGGGGVYIGAEKGIKYYYWQGKNSKKAYGVVGFKNGKSYAKGQYKLK